MKKPFADMTHDELIQAVAYVRQRPLQEQSILSIADLLLEVTTRYRVLQASFEEVCVELDAADVTEWQNLSRA